MVNKTSTRRKVRGASSNRKNVKSRKVMRGGVHTPRSPRSPGSRKSPRSPRSPGSHRIESGEFEYPDGTIYQGEILNGRFLHGKGKLIYPNGDYFIGHFDHNKRVGKGKEVFLNPDDGTIEESYEGDFVNDVRHGKGVYHSLNGKVYKGEFKDGLPNGKGSFTWSDGRSFKGKVVNNNPDYDDNDAVWKWANGKTYRGALSEHFGEEDLNNFSQDETIHSDYDDDDAEDDDFDD